jgi:hypothetical protein
MGNRAGKMAKDSNVTEYERLLTANLARVIDLLKFAEAKNAALLTFASVWAIAIHNVLVNSRSLTDADTTALGLARCLFIVSILVAVCSFLPKLRPESFHRNPDKPKNLLFYGDIASFSLLDTFRARLHEAYRVDGNPAAGERYLDDLVAQIWINSCIARRKNTFFSIGALIAFVGIGIAMLPTLIVAVHWLGSHLPQAAT